MTASDDDIAVVAKMLGITEDELRRRERERPGLTKLLPDHTPAQVYAVDEALRTVRASIGGVNSAASRNKQREIDLDKAAKALMRLQRNDVKEWKLKDIARESGIPLTRLQKLTLSAIRARAKS